MTKKHFIEAADMVKSISDERERKRTATLLATFFCKFNSRFDSSKFFTACDVTL